MARARIDTSKPLQLMVIDGPVVHIQTQPEVLIGLGFEAIQFGTKKRIPIQLAMVPERAAVLLQLLQELRDRGIVPDVPDGTVEQHSRH